MKDCYEMWLLYDKEGTTFKLPIPVLPEKITLEYGTDNKSVDIIGLGEVIVLGDRPAVKISFDSFFPGAYFSGVQPYVYDANASPAFYDSAIRAMMYADVPVKFIVTGMGVNLYCAIENYNVYEEAGDPLTLYYSIAFKEYRETKIRQAQIDPATGRAVLPPVQTSRVDARSVPGVHTVKPGDTLLKLAYEMYGSLGKAAKMMSKNQKALKNPLLINKGMKLYF